MEQPSSDVRERKNTQSNNLATYEEKKVSFSDNHNSLTEMYDKQDTYFQIENAKPVYKPSRIGITIFVLGLFSALFWLLFILISIDDLGVYILTAISFSIMLLGIIFLRKSLHVVKPLIGGTFLAFIALFGFLACYALIGHSIVLGIIPMILAFPVSLGAICAILRRKHRWAMLAGTISIFLGFNLLLFSPIFILMSFTSIILIFFSDEEFKD